MSEMEIDKNETKIWRNPHGQYHCEDGPAVDRVDGTRECILRGNITAKMGLLLYMPMGRKNGILMEKSIHLKTG